MSISITLSSYPNEKTRKNPSIITKSKKERLPQSKIPSPTFQMRITNTPNPSKSNIVIKNAKEPFKKISLAIHGCNLRNKIISLISP